VRTPHPLTARTRRPHPPARSVFESGLVLRYDVALALGAPDADRRREGTFGATCVVEAAGGTAEHAGLAVGAAAEAVKGTAEENYVKAASFGIGDEAGTQVGGRASRWLRAAAAVAAAVTGRAGWWRRRRATAATRGTTTA
jgi:hypothetical protein